MKEAECGTYGLRHMLWFEINSQDRDCFRIDQPDLYGLYRIHQPHVAFEHLKYGQSELRCAANVKYTLGYFEDLA